MDSTLLKAISGGIPPMPSQVYKNVSLDIATSNGPAQVLIEGDDAVLFYSGVSYKVHPTTLLMLAAGYAQGNNLSMANVLMNGYTGKPMLFNLFGRRTLLLPEIDHLDWSIIG